MIRKSFPCWEDGHRTETRSSTVFSVKTFFFKSHSLGGWLGCFALFLKSCQLYLIYRLPETAGITSVAQAITCKGQSQ